MMLATALYMSLVVASGFAYESQFYPLIPLAAMVALTAVLWRPCWCTRPE